MIHQLICVTAIMQQSPSDFDVDLIFGRSAALQTYLQVVPKLLSHKSLQSKVCYIDSWSFPRGIILPNIIEDIPSFRIYSQELTHFFEHGNRQKFRIVSTMALSTKQFAALKDNEILFLCYPRIRGRSYGITKSGKLLYAD